jgi:hypothetical protein
MANETGAGRADRLRIEARTLNYTPTIQAMGYTWEVHADTCLRDRGDGKGYYAMPWGLMPEGMRQQVMDAVRRGVVAQQASKQGVEVAHAI